MKKRTRAAALALALCLTVPAHAAGPAGAFPDVPEGAWYAQAADYCLEQGLMKGIDGLFRPEDAMTRAMLAQVLYNAAGAPAPEGAGAFPDVSAGVWYAGAAQWACESGLMIGDEQGRFLGESPVTREQLATILWRQAGAKPASGGVDGFSDGAEIAPYARTAVVWAEACGVISGFPDGRFAPRESATRAQAAVMLMNGRNLFSNGAVSLLPLGEGDIAPGGIARAEDGLVLTDLYNRRVWIWRDGAAELLAGGVTAPDVNGQPVGGYHDGPADQCSFKTPWAVAPFLEGWAVSDPENKAVRYISGDGVQTLNCSPGEQGLPADKGRVAFTYPTGLAADGSGNLYIADTHEGAIRKVAPDGATTTFAAGLSDPMGLCWSGGALYVAETGANRVVKIENGKPVPVAGSGEEGSEDGPAAQASFAFPQGVAADGEGTVYVSDTGSGAVRRIQDGQVSTVLSGETLAGQEDILAPAAPTGLLLMEGILYVCDSFNRAVYVIAL